MFFVTFFLSLRLKGKMEKKELHIINLILAGKTNEFSYFLDTYDQQVFHLIVRMVGSEEDAQELTQDTFMKAFSSLRKFNGDSSFSTWIYRIAYNTTVSFLRKNDNETVHFDESQWNSISETQIDDALSPTTDDNLRRLRAAFRKLTADERILITLFYEEERSISEIAEILHLSESNVKVKLHRVRKRLYLLIKEADEL